MSEAVVVTKRDVSVVIDGLTTTSSKIRALTSEGYSRSEISKSLGILYQHVRNVQLMPIKKQK